MSRWDDRIRAFAPELQDAPNGSLRIVFLLSAVLFAGAFATGVGQTIKVSRVLPGLSSNPAKLARSMIQEGNLTGAAQELEAYEAIIPRSNESVLELAGILSQLGRSREALDAYKRAVASLPNDPRAHAALGSQWFIRRKFPAAILSFEKVLKLDPQFENARENLAVSYLNEGRVDDAIAAYLHVIEFGMASAGTHDTLSRAYELVGDRQSALEHAGIAARLDPASSEIRTHLGVLRSGDDAAVRRP